MDISEGKYQLIKELVDKVKDYEKSGVSDQEMNLESFIRFVQDPDSHLPIEIRKMGGDQEKDVQKQGNEQETQIAILVTFMNRYAKLYAKKVLQHSPLSTLDEFSYLIVLLTHVSMTKTDLINKNVHEKTTGMEILKRLIKSGFIRQFDDTDDKRNQRIAITEAGRGVLFSVLGQMGDISRIITGNLTTLEKNSLTYILKKLDHFHFDIFMNERSTSLGEIISKKMGD